MGERVRAALNRHCLCVLLLCTAGLGEAAGTTDAAKGNAVPHWKLRSWSARDGAPGSIQAIAQTRDGYLWIGATTGLYRFDGVTFQRMPKSTGKRAQSEAVSALLATSSGGLLVGHVWGGLSVVKGERHAAIAAEIMGSTIRGLLSGTDGAVWTIAEAPDGAIVTRFSKGKWRPFLKGQYSPAERIGSAALGGDGTLWVTIHDQVFQLDQTADRLRRAGTRFPAAGQLTKARDGAVWLLTAEGMYRLSPAIGDRAASLGPNVLAMGPGSGERQAAFGSGGELWTISRTSGVVRYAERDGSPARVVDRLLADRAGQITPNAALVDREGSLWVGSESGLEQVMPASFGTALPGARASGTRWAETMVMRDGAGEVYLRQGRGLFQVRPGDEPRQLSQSMLPDDVPCPSSTSGVWMQDNKQALARVGSTLPPRRISLAGARGTGFVGGCVEDGAGRLWIVRAGTRTFGYLTPQGQGGVTLGDEARYVPNSVIADRQGRVLAYIGRGSLWRTDGRRVEALWPRQRVGIEFVEFLYQGPRYLFLGGPTGFARYDGRSFQVLSSTRFPFLANLSGAVQTRRGETWLQNSQGVLRVSTADLDRAFVDPKAALPGRMFDADDGLPGTSPYFSLSTVTEDKAGRIWVATNNGIAWADPAALPKNLLPPPIVISGLRAEGRLFHPQGLVALPQGSSRLEIDYTGLSLAQPGRMRFRYRLSGVDAGWIDAGAQRQASYTNLAPGTYRFQVIGANNDGVWNRTGASVNFTITPTFVQSRWFLLLCAVVAGVVLWVLYSLRLRQVTARIRSRQSERLAERERIARDLHDTLLQGFQGLILRFQSVANTIPADLRARTMMEAALDSADDVLAEGRGSVLQLRSADREDLPDALADTAARLRVYHAVAFEMVIEGSRRDLQPLVREELRRIGDEALINAFTHSRATIIELVVSYHRSALLVGIRDDGIGIDPTIFREGGRQGHFGLVGMRERAAQISAELKIASRPEIGTEILARVPADVAYVQDRRGTRWRKILRFLSMS
jgi:signal transduction histidine kinase/ligand-binding sensor domain-containing protein